MLTNAQNETKNDSFENGVQKVSKASEKLLNREKRNKRKSKVFSKRKFSDDDNNINEEKKKLNNENNENNLIKEENKILNKESIHPNIFELNFPREDSYYYSFSNSTQNSNESLPKGKALFTLEEDPLYECKKDSKHMFTLEQFESLTVQDEYENIIEDNVSKSSKINLKKKCKANPLDLVVRDLYGNSTPQQINSQLFQDTISCKTKSTFSERFKDNSNNSYNSYNSYKDSKRFKI